MTATDAPTMYAHFERAFGAPWRRGAIPTALDVLETDLKPLGAWQSPRLLPQAAEAGATEVPILWTRPLDENEMRRRSVLTFDKHAAYLGVLGGLELGIGAPIREDWHSLPLAEVGSIESQRPGYWRIRCDWPPVPDRFPDPLDRHHRRRKPGSTFWVTTPSLELARELGFEVEVYESYTWVRHRRLLRPFGVRCRIARGVLLEALGEHPGDDAARQLYGALGLLKSVYAPILGGFLARRLDRAREVRPPWYRPDWRHHIIAKARANLIRNLLRYRARGVEPIAIVNDGFYVAADADAPEYAAQAGIPLGDSLADFSIEAGYVLSCVIDRRTHRLDLPAMYAQRAGA